MPEKAPFSAQVVVASPVPETAERAVRAFQALGFKTGPVVGDSFSIEAPLKLFRDVFRVPVAYDKRGRAVVRGAQDPITSLPVAALPSSLQKIVRHVLFTEPPAFGPGTVP